MLMSGVIGCAKSVSDYCLIAKPITPTKADAEVISDELVMQILEHDETYFSLCNKKSHRLMAFSLLALLVIKTLPCLFRDRHLLK